MTNEEERVQQIAKVEALVVEAAKLLVHTYRVTISEVVQVASHLCRTTCARVVLRPLSVAKVALAKLTYFVVFYTQTI